MQVTTLTKQEIHLLNQERFRKTPQEKLDSKKAKSEWKIWKKTHE